jgi:Flp pilus assembly protein TadD
MKEPTDLHLDLIVEGDKLSARGDDAEAETAYREAVSHDPDDPGAHTALGGLLVRVKRYAEAEAELREAIRLDHARAASHEGLGWALCSLARNIEAEAEFRAAILLDPEEFNAHNGLGIVLENLGKAAEAEAEYREAMRLNSDDPWPPTNLGNLLRSQGRHSEAEIAFRDGIRADPGHSNAHSGLGLAFVDQEKNAEAEAAFREAIGCDPGNTDAHRGLGCVLWDAKRYAEAEAEFRVLVSLDLTDADAQRNLAEIARDMAGQEADLDGAAYHRLRPFRRWRHATRGRTPPDAATLLTYPPAAARRRFLAGAFDYGPWVALLFLFGPATVLTDPFTISMVPVYLLFNGLLEGLTGQSIGKALFGLYTIRAGTGEFTGGGTGMYRRVLHVLDTLPLVAGWAAGLVTGRTFADRIAGTVVVRRPLPAAG